MYFLKVVAVTLFVSVCFSLSATAQMRQVELGSAWPIDQVQRSFPKLGCWATKAIQCPNDLNQCGLRQGLGMDYGGGILGFEVNLEELFVSWTQGINLDLNLVRSRIGMTKANGGVVSFELEKTPTSQLSLFFLNPRDPEGEIEFIEKHISDFGEGNPNTGTLLIFVGKCVRRDY